MHNRSSVAVVICSFLAALASGCGADTVKHGPLPCNEVNNVKCGNGCTTTSDCGAGLYCAANSTCSADCVVGGAACGKNQFCDYNGQCESTGNPGGTDGGIVCPAGLQCNVACSGTGTSISGKVYDPAGKNPLYNVTVYVPQAPLTPLPKGVPTGANACSCGALFTSGAVVSTSTAEDGSFTLPNAPVGANVPLVLQVGKWRRQVTINVTQCQDNPQPDKSLAFLGTLPAGDTNDNIPDIAVSTGSADSLECLMRRIGLPTTEYVAGNGTTGHVHVFSGGNTGMGGGGNGAGTPENPPMTGAPASYTDLWMSQDQLMPYDIVLLSCEGGETYKANPPALESYLNAGGRVFASHFHYSWFAGPLSSMQAYTAPMDWGTNIATWVAGGGNDGGPIGGIIDTMLNGSMMPFPKGVSLQKWLTNVMALGQNMVAAGELSIYDPRYNATVAATNTSSQAWITSDATGMAGSTMYLSFDTPVNAPPGDGGVPAYCGRAVFSDLHVAGNPATKDKAPPPDGCADADLSPQEKALEFMLFDLSSCVIPDTVPPTSGVPIG